MQKRGDVYNRKRGTSTIRVFLVGVLIIFALLVGGYGLLILNFKSYAYEIPVYPNITNGYFNSPFPPIKRIVTTSDSVQQVQSFFIQKLENDGWHSSTNRVLVDGKTHQFELIYEKGATLLTISGDSVANQTVFTVHYNDD